MAFFRPLIFVLTLFTSLFAASPRIPRESGKGDNERDKDLVYTLEFGGNYTNGWIKPKHEQQSRGNLGGAQALFEYRPLDRFYGGVSASWRQGDTDCSAEKRSLSYIDIQERLGYTVCYSGKEKILTFFSGFGYRHLRQHVRPKESVEANFNGSFFPPFLTTSTDVILEYHEFYVPLGVYADFVINSFASAGLHFTWMPQVFPMVDIKPLGNAFWSLTYMYGNFLIEVPFTFTLTQNHRWRLILKPTYEFWQDGRSKAKTSTGIPLNLLGNTYQFFGINLDFAYVF
jgi:hypothetical protein